MPKDVTPPHFGGPTSAETSGDDAVLVSWKPATDDVTPSARIVYDVAWGDHSGFSPDWSAAIRTKPGATNTVVRGLATPETPFFFRARGVDEAGNADDNAREVTASTGPDTTPPKFAGCRAVRDISYESFVVEWDRASDNGTTPSDIVYEVWVRPAGSSGDPRATKATLSVTGALEGTISGLSPGKRYEVFCSAKDSTGNQDENGEVIPATTTADTNAPTFGGVVAATPGEPRGTALVTWNAASDDGIAASDIVYLVYVSDTPGGEDFSGAPTAETQPGMTSLVVSGLQTRTTYYVVVRAKDHAGNVDSNTNEASVHLFTSFERDVQPIFTANCAILVCHTVGADGTNPPIQGEDLDPGAAYSNIVNVVAREGSMINEPNIKRADATSTDPMKSYVWRKITGVNIFGSQMPPAQAQRTLTVDQIQTIEDWIVEGAQNN